MSGSPLERVLAALPEVRQTKPDAWMARCPAHDDLKQSLSVGVGNKGVVLRCFAGCETASIVQAMGLTMADLFPPRAPERPASARKRIVREYDYTDERGNLLYQVVRYEPKDFRQRRPDPAKSGVWLWSLQGVRRVLYRLPEVLAAVRESRGIVLVEGEKDADNLARLGIVATTNAGGADKWTADYSASLKGAHVVLIPDNDDPGRKHVRRAGADLQEHAAMVRVLDLPGLPSKGDVSDWLKAGGTVEDLRQMAAAAPLWSEWIAAYPEETSASGVADSTTPELPLIETNNQHLRDISAAALAALVSANDPPTVFVRSGQLVRIEEDENGRPIIRPLGVVGLRSRLARVADFVSTSEKRGVVRVAPPDKVCEDLLHLAPWPGLPALEAIVTAPVVAPDGTLVTTPGYLPAARVYYRAVGQQSLPDIIVTPETVSQAKTLLLDTMLGDFPYVDESSRAHALALLLLPFVRTYIGTATPLHLVDAPTPGTGKSLLVEGVTALFLGQPAAAKAGDVKDDDEWRKRITSALGSGSPFAWFDNINRRLDSGALALALTAREWSDRQLGANVETTLPVRCAWIGTANNISLSDELTRRCVWIRLDAGVERPEDRDPTAFKVRELIAWVREERSHLLAAVATLLRAWIEAGRPCWRESKPMGSFQRWADVLGGILEVIEVCGFLENRAELYDRADPERERWTAFLRAWYENHQDAPKGASDVIELAVECELIPDDTRGSRNVFGRALRAKADRIFGGLRLVHAGKQDRLARYRVLLASGASGLFSETDEALLSVLPDSDFSDVSNVSNVSNLPQHEKVNTGHGNTFEGMAENHTGHTFHTSADTSDPVTAGLSDPFASDCEHGEEGAAF